MSYEEEDTCHMRRRIHVTRSCTHHEGVTYDRGDRDLV
jgi:hypothetical protein